VAASVCINDRHSYERGAGGVTSIGILKENISKSMFFKIKKPIDAVLPGRLRCTEIKKLVKSTFFSI